MPIQRVIRRVRDHLDFRRRQKKWPNLIHSGASHPELVHPTAIIHHSSLSGEVEVSEHADIGDDVVIAGSKIKIGRYTAIAGPHTEIFGSSDLIQIGAFCSIARQVVIQGYNHRTDRLSTWYAGLNNIVGEDAEVPWISKGPIIIGNDVWIGTHCIITSGSVIGNGAVIGANSVVTGVIPAFAIAVGSPARVMKYRFEPEAVQKLLAIKWWDWPLERLKMAREYFEGPLTADRVNAIEKAAGAWAAR